MWKDHCGWHHSPGWDPKLYKKGKWVEHQHSFVDLSVLTVIAVGSADTNICCPSFPTSMTVTSTPESKLTLSSSSCFVGVLCHTQHRSTAFGKNFPSVLCNECSCEFLSAFGWKPLVCGSYPDMIHEGDRDSPHVPHPLPGYFRFYVTDHLCLNCSTSLDLVFPTQLMVWL